jgi:hypothetical protein
VDGASSSSQKLAANATTTAIQMRIPKAQEPTVTPAKLSRRGAVVALMPSTAAAAMASGYH